MMHALWMVAALAASALVLLVAAIFFYQAIRGLWGVRAPAPLAPRRDKRFGVLVPAHNEEGVLGPLFASLARVDYPRERLAILFVADHCTDATVAEIRAAGFDCLDRQSGARGKTASLAEGITTLEAKHGEALDAVAFFDADNLVDPLFFQQAAAGLHEGHAVLQGRVGVHNWQATLFSRLNYMNAVVENRLEELARSQAGWSCNLRGHGMVFRRDVLQRMPWHSDTMVEDQEMLVKLVCSGQRVHWLEHARASSVIPETAKEAAAQRRRWAGGRSAIVGRSVRALWARFRASGDGAALNLLIDFLLPSHAVQLSLLFVAIVVAAAVCGFASWQFLLAFALLPAYLLYFIAGNLLSGVPAKTFLDILWAPAFIAWRTWIYLTSLSGVKRWR
ncbi:glycosyltransferase family 2 protein [Rhizobacter sp. OV335]|uniref:glycosyltransferase family 2 protein n=1 Tax=Rhizobacter sp. OV335 TaxID=1500264 RepID=UPI0009136920|nr:glycosyltransferase family 2 protein [Rhizobacter sp. OV335]SHN36079.1 Glycosyltransferase, catalytic subunit of cellulose synthase and poly-beta-1,6-N-acetylglucosamine synthase [Rhizobacter sp. OV335]